MSRRLPVSRVVPRLVLSTAFVATTLVGGRAAAQEWPSSPVSAFDGRVTFGGDLTLTVGSEDLGYFNYTDYDRSTLRLARLDFLTTATADEHVSFLLELRAEGDLFTGHWTGSPYAAFVRLRPWTTRAIEIQGGRIPSAFGGFAERAYGAGNPLIGYPLASQYLMSLREDSVPRNADELLDGRGRGWYIGYSVGDPYFESGVPIASAFRYDTGVLTRVGGPRSRIEWLGSVTTGTLSAPLVGDDNGSPQVASRIVVRPTIGLAIGVSAARGAFVADRVRDELTGDLGRRQYPQRAFEADVEYSRDYWLVRTEATVSAWTLPAIEAPLIEDDLVARSWLVEGRYTILPQLYVAARYDWLGFSEVHGSARRDTWDADVQRVEAGAGYRLARTVTLKGSVQHNSRDGGRVRTSTLGALQVVLWF